MLTFLSMTPDRNVGFYPGMDHCVVLSRQATLAVSLLIEHANGYR